MIETSQINDLIFKELIKRGYSLEGNTRIWNIADSKLWYLTPEQAQAYLEVENSKKYKEEASSNEYHLIEENIDNITNSLGGEGAINIIDLGCGDGKKAAHIFSRLKDKFKIRYCPIDISGYMVNKAIETFSNLDVEEVIEFQYNISDFENLENITSLLNKDKFKKNLFLLLGYTLGNFEVNELLYEIRSAMGFDDELIIVSGIESEKWQEWAKSRKDDEKLNNFLIKIPMQLGLNRDEVEFGARLKNHRVEYYYTIKEDKKIVFQGKTQRFNKNDQIIVAVSYKHNKENLLTILNMQFGRVDLQISKDGSTFIALCKK